MPTPNTKQFNLPDEWTVEQVINNGSSKPVTKAIGKVLPPIPGSVNGSLKAEQLDTIWRLCNYGLEQLEPKKFNHSEINATNFLSDYDGLDTYELDGFRYIALDGAPDHVNEDIFVTPYDNATSGYAIVDTRKIKDYDKSLYIGKGWAGVSRSKFLNYQERFNLSFRAAKLQRHEQQTAYDKSLFVVDNFSYLRNNPNEYQEFANSVKLETWGDYPYTFNFNGDASKLPKRDFELYENAVDAIKKFHDKVDGKETDRQELRKLKSNERLAKDRYETHLLDNLYKTITTIKNNKNMAKKKTEEPAVENKQQQPKKKTAQKTDKSKPASKEETSKEEIKNTASKKEDAKVENTVNAKEATKENAQKNEGPKREPQFVTCNGDRITHAHYWFKKDNPTAYLSVKFNDKWLPSKALKPEEAAALDQLRGNKAEQNAMFRQLFEQYYPVKVAPKLPDAEFKFPQTYDTPAGEITVSKYNFYIQKDDQTQKYFGPTYVYAEIHSGKTDKTMKVSAIADDNSVENYYNHTRSPKDQVLLSFGRQLGIDNAKEHYQQFNLPDGVQFDKPQTQITLSKVSGSNNYMLTVDCPNGQKLETKLPYWDANAFFSKNASKEQLAAKFFSTDLAAMDWSKKPEQKQEVQKSMAMK